MMLQTCWIVLDWPHSVLHNCEFHPLHASPSLAMPRHMKPHFPQFSTFCASEPSPRYTDYLFIFWPWWLGINRSSCFRFGGSVKPLLFLALLSVLTSAHCFYDEGWSKGVWFQKVHPWHFYGVCYRPARRLACFSEGQCSNNCIACLPFAG